MLDNYCQLAFTSSRNFNTCNDEIPTASDYFNSTFS